MQWGLILFAIVASILNTVQSGSNATLNKVTMSPVWSSAIVFAVALASTVVAGLVGGQRLPNVGALGQVPWWAWIGGVLGAVYILSVMLVVDKVGAAVFTGITVTVAVVTSLAMDHYGLLGFAVHKAGWGRAFGGACMIAGLILIAKF